MPQIHTRSEPSLLPIDRPRCPKCQGRMMLARIDLVPRISICGPLNVQSARMSRKRWSKTR
jgi:hypothetical protein